jgi:hypothetical protein
MNQHLAEISHYVSAIARRIRAGAGWHSSPRLIVPDNIVLLPLPPSAPELNATDPEEDRCLCHSVGAPQVQADAPSDQRSATSGEPPARRPLATLSWQRPNIGSWVNEMFMHGSAPEGETPPGNSPAP